jgi:hypothetical protein
MQLLQIMLEVDLPLKKHQFRLEFDEVRGESDGRETEVRGWGAGRGTAEGDQLGGEETGGVCSVRVGRPRDRRRDPGRPAGHIHLRRRRWRRVSPSRLGSEIEDVGPPHRDWTAVRFFAADTGSFDW